MNTPASTDRVFKIAAIVAPIITVLTLFWAAVALPGDVQELKDDTQSVEERVDTLEKIVPVLDERMKRFDETQRQTLDLLRDEIRRHHN